MNEILKLNVLNASVLAVSLTNAVETFLSISLLVLSIGWTVLKLKQAWNDNKKKD